MFIQIAQDIIDGLEMDCPECQSKDAKDKGCEVCRGVGQVPTELGQSILNLVRKYMERQQV